MALTRRGVLMSLSGLAATALAGLTGRAAVSRYYDGPVSDHFDGTYFFDPHGAPPKSFVDLARWWSSREGEPWPQWAPSPFLDRPPARIDGGTLRISYVGHASLLVQTAGINLLIDPVWSDRVSPLSFAGPKRVVCHEHRHEYWRCATVREMKEGPSGSAIRSRSQATASCCGQNPWW
jgi:hypothetical protein